MGRERMNICFRDTAIGCGAANSPRSITCVKMRDLPDDTIYFGGFAVKRWLTFANPMP